MSHSIPYHSIRKCHFIIITSNELRGNNSQYFTHYRPTPPSPTVVAQIDSSVACLWLLTPLSAGTAVAAIIIAVTTNNWLHTQENMLSPSFNGTGKYELVAKHTVSGLWRICHTERKYNKQLL